MGFFSTWLMPVRPSETQGIQPRGAWEMARFVTALHWVHHCFSTCSPFSMDLHPWPPPGLPSRPLLKTFASLLRPLSRAASQGPHPLSQHRSGDHRNDLEGGLRVPSGETSWACCFLLSRQSHDTEPPAQEASWPPGIRPALPVSVVLRQ